MHFILQNKSAYNKGIVQLGRTEYFSHFSQPSPSPIRYQQMLRQQNHDQLVMLSMTVFG